MDRMALLTKLFNIQESPNTIQYLAKYGIDAAISSYLIPKNKYANAEELYADCLRQGVRWEEIIKEPPANVLL
jgi:hypothetical protein